MKFIKALFSTPDYTLGILTPFTLFGLVVATILFTE